MATFNSHKELITAINSLSHKLQDGDLSIEELDEFQQLAQQLYERLVIMNFKAKERFASEDNHEVSSVDDGMVFSPEEEVTIEPSESAPSEGILFDFSEEDSLEELEEKSKELKSTEKENQEEPVIDTVNADTIEISDTPEIEDETSKIEVTTTTKTEITTDEVVYSFYEKFTQVHDDSLMKKLSSQKIDSLQGAFGLNDRFQIINELFHGDATSFEKAIEQLDNQESSQKARITLSEIAAQHQWEPDNILVEDFAKMIERRYA